ncbi:MAG: hypothetical protein FJX77_08005 [Armatimonadetes bacterium]|nr:hypothetical protein [Armatimonadota bacterium]
MIAADIEGPGMEGPDQVGIWATMNIEAAGTVSWVNTLARENTALLGGSGEGTTRYTPTAHGIAEATKCTRDALGG